MCPLPNTSKKKFFFTNKKNSKWVSKCYSTLIGWYHKGDEWGCYYAEKVGVDPNKITNEEVQNKLVVVENSVKTTIKIFLDLLKFPDKNVIIFLKFKLFFLNLFIKINLLNFFFNMKMRVHLPRLSLDNFFLLLLKNIKKYYL